MNLDKYHKIIKDTPPEVRKSIEQMMDIQELEDIMLKFGQAHDMLAKTSLINKEYQPISSLFASAKVDLFNYYLKIKNDSKKDISST